MIIDHGQARVRVVEEALSWVGTSYHHHARVKGCGVDCAQLLLAVYETTGVIEPIDVGLYPTDWHLHRSEEMFLAWLEKAGAVEIEQPQPGDIALFKYGRCFSHGAVVIEPGRVVHSYIDIGVRWHRLCEAPLHGRPVRYFTPWH
jgi:cell wall-associated NlpC family hydrolase